MYNSSVAIVSHVQGGQVAKKGSVAQGWSEFVLALKSRTVPLSISGLGWAYVQRRFEWTVWTTTVWTTKRSNCGHGNVRALLTIESYLYHTTWDCIVIPRYNEVLIAAENFVKPRISLSQGLYISAVQIMYRCLKHCWYLVVGNM